MFNDSVNLLMSFKNMVRWHVSKIKNRIPLIIVVDIMF